MLRRALVVTAPSRAPGPALSVSTSLVAQTMLSKSEAVRADLEIQLKVEIRKTHELNEAIDAGKVERCAARLLSEGVKEVCSCM